MCEREVQRDFNTWYQFDTTGHEYLITSERDDFEDAADECSDIHPFAYPVHLGSDDEFVSVNVMSDRHDIKGLQQAINCVLFLKRKCGRLWVHLQFLSSPLALACVLLFPSTTIVSSAASHLCWFAFQTSVAELVGATAGYKARAWMGYWQEVSRAFLPSTSMQVGYLLDCAASALSNSRHRCRMHTLRLHCHRFSHPLPPPLFQLCFKWDPSPALVRLQRQSDSQYDSFIDDGDLYLEIDGTLA